MGTSYESLVFDLLTRDRASEGLQRIGKSAAGASVSTDELIKTLDDLGKKSVAARVALKGNDAALAQLDRIDAKLIGLDRRTAVPEIKLEGAARAAAEMAALDVELGKLGESGGTAGGRLSALAGTGGIAGGGMGALIAAGVALSPVLVTLAFGLGGVAAAAYGVLKPISNAARATGGLQANLGKLGPEQQQVALSLLALGKDFGFFERSVQPQILGDFNQAILLADHLLSDLQPVTKATATALGGMLGQIDAEFQSGTWQSFFTWMAQNAGPDVQLLSSTFVTLLDTLPPLLTDLQPVARAILLTGDDAAKAARQVVGFYDAFQRDVPISNQHTIGFLQRLDKWTVDLTNHLGPWARAINNAGTSAQHLAAGSAPAAAGIAGMGGVAVNAQARLLALNKAADALSASWVSAPAKAAPATDAITRIAVAEQAAFRAAGPATDQITRLGTSARIGAGRVKPLTDQITMTAHANEAASRTAGPLTDEISRLVIPAKAAAVRLADVAKAVTAINTAESTALATATAYAGDLVTTANDAHALEQALRKSHDEIGLHTAIQRASFGAANTYITDLGNTAAQAYKSGHGVDASIKAIRTGLPILDQAKTKNQAYWGEVKTLVGWLNKLRLEKAIHESVFVSGSGTFTVKAGTKLGLPGGTAGGPFGAGGMIRGGIPGKDSVLISAMPGELVVPTHMVSAGLVDHLRGALPGFASGGLVPSYSGSVAGLVPWSRHDLNAAVAIFEQATAKATFAAMKAAAAAARAAASGFGHAGPGGGAPAANAALARRMFPNENFAAWNYVAMRESGWNQFARNPSSGAYGIAQALPPTKYPFAGQAAGGSNPAAQISWMEGYMRSRYGGAAGAAAHERAFNWYDNGGWLHPGVTMAVNTTGRSERVLPPGRSGTAPLVQFGDVHIHDATDPVIIGQRVSAAIVAASLGS